MAGDMHGWRAYAWCETRRVMNEGAAMGDSQNHGMREFGDLSEEELDSLGGGLIVSYADGYLNLVIDDATGEWVEEVYNDLDLAIEDARDGGFGDRIIHVGDDDFEQYAAWLKKSRGPR